MIIFNYPPHFYNRFMQKPLLLFTLSFFFVLTIFMVWLNTQNSQPFRTDLKQSIIEKLRSIDSLSKIKKVDVVYILGGNQKSLQFKAKTVSELFHNGICKRIWVLSSSGITEYNPSLGRNWTNDEWTIMRLGKYGIPKEDIELIKVDEGFFGTYSEAKDVSNLIIERGHNSVLLIAQPYHTRRVRTCFNKTLGSHPVSVYIHDSGEKMPLRYLIVEYIKLKVYQYFLI